MKIREHTETKSTRPQLLRRLSLATTYACHTAHFFGGGCVIAPVVAAALAGVADGGGAGPSFLFAALCLDRADRSAEDLTAASTRPLSLPFSASIRSRLKMKGTSDSNEGKTKCSEK
jgi:hypothetical protein